MTRIQNDQLPTGNVSFNASVLAASLRVTEVITTPAGASPAATLTLANGNHQTLSGTAASETIAVTLTVPSSASAGTIIVKQHATTPVGINWAVSSGSVIWLGIQPTWSSDGVSKIRIVAWRFDGTDTYLSATDTN